MGLVGQGMARVETIREGRLTEQTCCRWRKLHGGMRQRQAIAEQSSETRLHRADPQRDEGQVHCGAIVSSPMDGELRICRGLGQHRSTQRHRPRCREDKEPPVAYMIELARQYGSDRADARGGRHGPAR